MTGAEDSETQEASEDKSAADESTEKPESSYGHASISEDTTYESGEVQREAPYRIISKKTATKKVVVMGSLERAVSEANVSEEKSNSNYTTIKPILNLAERIEAAHGNDSDDSADSSENNNTANSAVLILYKKDEKTGELKFFCEQKPLDHPNPGMLSLVGGRIQKGEKSLDALVRELSEELEEPAASIVIKLLDKYSFYQRLPYEHEGVKGYSDIYAVEIRHEASWNALEQARFKHDAGFPRVLKQHELRVEDFAFGYGEVVKKFAEDNSRLGSNKTPHSLHNGNQYLASSLLPSLDSRLGSKKFSPFLYADSVYMAQSPLPSFGLSNIASLSPVQPYNEGMWCSQNRLAA